MQSIGRFTTRMTHLVEDGLSRADEAPLVDGAERVDDVLADGRRVAR